MPDGVKIIVDHASKLEGSVVAFRNVDLQIRNREVPCVEAARFYREKGVQSRPIHIHGIDFVSSEPHIFTDHVQAEEYEKVLQLGMVLVIEPNAVTADGMLGSFFGHTFIITDDEPECVDGYPWELTVVR